MAKGSSKSRSSRFSTTLFLGFPLDDLYNEQLKGQDPALLAYYINGEGLYLREFSAEGLQFIGKEAGELITLAQLGELEKHLYSLLRLLVPEYPYEETPLYLVGV